MEIKLSKIAEEKIKEAVEENNETAILRIYVEKAACSGARFGIAFDNPREGDERTEVNGIIFITDNVNMPVYSNGIDIDYVSRPKEGFIIQSLGPVESGCGGSCGGCGGGCSK